MADILKVTTPMVDKIPQNQIRPTAPDPTMPFNLSDVTRVTQMQELSELLQQNTGLTPGETDAPKILTQLLMDPAVTASMIGSISLVQEVIRLMPATNNALTTEIEQLFDQLLMNPEEIAAELQRQEESTTLFKGKLFDQLRGLLAQSGERPEIDTGVGVLLKALNAVLSRADVLDSAANNLAFLAKGVHSSAQLSGMLLELADALRQPNAAQSFLELRDQIMEALGHVQESVLYSPAMEKVVPLIIYNLSRFNDNPDFLPDALALLLHNMDGEAQKSELVHNLESYLDKVLFHEKGDGPPNLSADLAAQQLALRLRAYYAQPPAVPSDARGVDEESKVIETLAKIISKQAANPETTVVTGDKVDKIINSLLASPSNFTPLLHFIVPVEHDDMRAFAEIWVDPNAEGEDARGRGKNNDATHMLMVFDVEGIGRFESELYVQNKRIALNLLCPPAYVEEFKGLGPAIRQAVVPTGYSFETINIDRMERTHSLMDVFTDLPHKRTGIDVKV